MSIALRRRALDVAPTVALLAIGGAQMLADYHQSGYRGARGVNAAFLVATCVPLLIRRAHPALALAGVFVAQGVWIGIFYHGSQQPPFEPFAAGVVACFALGRHADRRALRAGAAVFALVVIATAIVLVVGGSTVGNALPVLVWWLAAIGFGRGLRDRQVLVELLRDRSARLERDREREIAGAALEERARIARELHDVIAHAVSLMVVQASAERRLLEPGQQRTADTLETIETSGREALGELRRLLGVLCASGRERLAPQPGLATLPELIEEARRSGHAIRFEAEGEPVRLPAGLDLTAYRIVQEGLTNARKHAPGAAVDVTLRWRPAELEIEVADDGPGPPPSPNGGGHGLIGMRERTSLYGGVLRTETARGGGFRVQAHLPIEDASRG
ncbi:MAG TPA: histidine kinase [Solirubrobacter sp.]|nr:histidine kinase [Solirubrobacter sp.]